MPKLLNLGCGEDIRKSVNGYEWINHDLHPREGVDKAWNLEETPLPWPDNFFDLVNASHVLEHIQNLIPLMKELHRILVPSGILTVYVPHFSCRAAIADPTHVRQFTPETFYHFVHDGKLGFDTSGCSGLFKLAWLEVITHKKGELDYDGPGSYFTEIMAELEKR
ncbi:MAG: class I SAM-dependent methyltransferase [Deltaproteobacteria bacterium]|nr:class I SAM-dependent methyltransferase [Deltaproteobacteria bacterium]